MARTPKHKIIYANAMNLTGLYSTKPVRCKWDAYTGLWWDSSGEFDVDKLGTDDRIGITTFASFDKKEVKFWTQGAMTVCERLKRVLDFSDESP